MPIDVNSIASKIKVLGLAWQAKANVLTALSDAELKLRLGATPPPGHTMADFEKLAEAQVHATATATATYPASFDARTKDWVTSVKDQGGCGSCVAFGTTATVESAVRAFNAHLPSDLSEAQVFYCYGKAAGATCGSGWWPDGALDGYKKGVVDEACFPYTAGDQTCKLCSDSSDRLTLISNWHTITSTSDMKIWLSTRGPLTTCFTVYNDFFAYSTGTYTPDPTTGVAGGHCVSVVGYSDQGKYWICKNSWGSGWGEQGFFCIAYNKCGIDAQMWAVDGIVDSGWRNGQRIDGVWAIDQDYNAWVNLSDFGWKKIQNDKDNVFYDMLSQILAAKAAGHSINVHLTNGLIDQIYS